MADYPINIPPLEAQAGEITRLRALLADALAALAPFAQATSAADRDSPVAGDGTVAWLRAARGETAAIDFRLARATAERLRTEISGEEGKT